MSNNLRPLADVSEVSGVTVVTFRDLKLPDGRHYPTDTLEKVVKPLVENNLGGRLVLDLGTVEYLPSHSIGKLLVIRKSVHDGKGRLVLCGVRPQIDDVFEVTGIKKLFEFAPDVNSALAAIGVAKKA